MLDDVGFLDGHFKGCEKCGGRGFIEEDNSAKPCECWRKDTLRSRFKKSQIPEEFFNIPGGEVIFVFLYVLC